MRVPTRLVWLFDVDGTLLSTDGAARGVFSRVIGEWLGVEDDLQGVSFAGRTDPLILADILARHDQTFDEARTLRFWHEVSRRMEALLPGTRARLLPGVSALLDAVAGDPGWVTALLTGNTSHMARVKLGYFAIHDRFAFGAYGEEAADRNALACVAVERAAREFGVRASQCVVLGDTEHDVACARAAGARAVAVATGARDRATLESSGPDLLLDDFTQQETLLAWARRIEREA